MATISNVPRTTKRIERGQAFEVTESGGAVAVQPRPPVLRWEANPVVTAYGEPALVRAVLTDFDGEPRTDTFPDARFEVDGRWFAPAPIVEGILVADVDFGFLEGEHVLRFIGAPVSAEILSVRIDP